jgi:cell division protein FtsB
MSITSDPSAESAPSGTGTASAPPAASPSAASLLDTAAQQALLDYVNAAAAVTSYATAVSQTKLPALVFTPDWYGSYITSFEQVQAHALTWLNGLLPEISALPGAIIQADALVQAQLIAVGAKLTQLAANPGDPAAKDAAQAALLALQGTLEPVKQALDNLDGNLLGFVTKLSTDLTTLQSMADAANSASGADQDEVARLTGIIAELRAAIANREEVAHLNNLVAGNLAIFIVVLAATIGWEGGPVTEGLLGMALLGLASWIGPKVASTADVTALQEEITSVQQEISTESVEMAAIQTTVTGFQQLVGAGSGTQQALAEVTGSWTSESDAIDAVLAELSNAQSDVSHEQVAAAQAAMAGLAQRWTALVAAMQLLSGVSVQVAGQPVPITS